MPVTLQIELIKVYELLFSVVGNEPQQLRHWLNTYNHHLKKIPLDLLAEESGRVQIMDYLVAFTGS